MNFKKRIEWVDLAKGIAILLVVFGHALQGTINSNGLTLFGDYSSITVIYKIIYGFHMPLFFFLSALFTGFLKRSAKSVILQKTKRLLVPYFIWSLVVAFFMQIASKYTNSGLGIIDFLISPIVPFSEYWFLYVLFFMFVFYLLMRIFFHSKTRKIVLIISVLLFIIEPFLPNYWILINFSKNLVFFAIGTYFFDLMDIIKIKKTNLILVISAIIFLIINLLYVFIIKNLDENNIVNYFWYLTSITGIVFSVNISMFFSFRKKII